MIVITGASDGLGLQLAKLYQAKGKTVVNVSRRPCEFAEHNIELSLREGPQIEEAAHRILAMDEPLEVLINCAGVLSLEPLGDITENEIKRLMSTNVKPAILLVSHMIERIRKDGTDIVNVGSTISFKADPDRAVYGASKWALRGFTENLRLELADTQSRVLFFCPSRFQSSIYYKAADISEGSSNAGMPTESVALCLTQLIALPKCMEVSEIIINRKTASL